MKKKGILIAWLLAVCPAAFGQTYYLEQLKVENRSVEKLGRTVKVAMDINLDEVDMKLQHSLRLVPVLVSADGTRELALGPVLVNGRVRNKVMERRVYLGEMQEMPAQTRLCRRNGQAQTIHYEEVVPFSRWMIDGRLDVRGYISGCAECSEGDGVVATGGVLPYQEPQLLLSSAIQPKEEAVKQRSETRSARIRFRQGRHTIEPAYEGNRAELEAVHRSLAVVKDNRDLTITGIYVTGYASPEGSFEYNMKLSERRARAFTEYVKDDLATVPADLYHVDWKGEDWAGLRAEVEKYPQLLKQNEVLAIIDNCGSDKDACEKQLKALVPPEIYQRLLNEMYPAVRRNEYRVAYNVRHFDLNEAKQWLKSRPDLLSVAEIHKVADSYGRNTDAYREALQIAVRTYPDDLTARHNAALAEIETGHHEAAMALLRDARQGDLLNLLGVACFKTGRMAEAKEAFAKGEQAGSARAGQNLRMLQEVENLLAE